MEQHGVPGVVIGASDRLETARALGIQFQMADKWSKPLLAVK
jgi:hypothetical protein